jgi:hypothetical protein
MNRHLNAYKVGRQIRSFGGNTIKRLTRIAEELKVLHIGDFAPSVANAIK